MEVSIGCDYTSTIHLIGFEFNIGYCVVMGDHDDPLQTSDFRLFYFLRSAIIPAVNKTPMPIPKMTIAARTPVNESKANPTITATIRINNPTITMSGILTPLSSKFEMSSS